METQNPFLVHINFPQFPQTLISESRSSIPSQFDRLELSLQSPAMTDYHQLHVSDVQVVQINDHIKNKGKIRVLNSAIELNDDGDDDNDDDDDDCVFVKKERNSTSKGNRIQDPIYVDGLNPKLDKKDVELVQCVDDYDDNDDDDDVMIVSVKESPILSLSLSSSSWSRPSKRKKPFSGFSIKEVGESSGSKMMDSVNVDDDDVVEVEPPLEVMFSCEICADIKPRKESFKIKGCCHSYCYECMKSYVASKLQDGVSRISCPVPSCIGVLEPEYCREILPLEVFDRWGKLLCESVLLASEKFYCPFKDCSALLIDDGGEVVRQCECPSCFRMFCAQCKVAWHEGIECAEFQKLNKDERQKEDIMLRKLAKDMKWQRCPTCKFYVEKKEGCLYMKCRCGVAFCYSCGDIHTDHRYHYCKKCGR